MSAIERLRADRFVAILRRPPDLDAAAEELVAAGIGVLEITLDTPGALDAITRWRERATVLAGTVRTQAEADAAAAAGAQALVSPTLVFLEHKVPHVPGAFTPTEVETAWRAGAPLVKLFPAGSLGPGYVRALLAPLPDVQLLVTGGITAENACDFLDAGAIAVGADSSRALAVWEAVKVGA
jgi:2-dehydro-3-deoxyphosphogluconate aldolase / (4S)-4-hydroxy-2-oxoglutarate aldolase